MQEFARGLNQNSDQIDEDNWVAQNKSSENGESPCVENMAINQQKKNLQSDTSYSSLNKYNLTLMAQLSEQQDQGKTDFMESDQFNNFTDMLVIAQIRSDLNNRGIFMLHVQMIENAIHKAVRRIVIQNHQCEDKEQYETLKSQLVRTFIQDIGVGFITSTGQLKATCYIYVNNNIVEHLNQHQIPLKFKKLMQKITLFFSCKDALSKYQNLVQCFSPTLATISLSNFANILKEEKKTSAQTTSTNLTLQQSCILSNPQSSISGRRSEIINDLSESQISIQQSTSKKLLLNQSLWVKTAFIRTDKFKNEFIAIQKIQDEVLKSGVSIHFVYKPMDDQIYAIKKSTLNSVSLNFYDVFSTMNIQDNTQDHRKIREAKILSKMNHPNVLRLFDWWVEEEFTGTYALYMQLEYCSYPGYTHQTNDLLNFSFYYLNPMGNEEKVQNIRSIMKQIVDGLEYIHNRGIVHRDLKPENVFVSISVKGKLQVMLADFDQGKDVRELKLSIITDEKITEDELNSVKSRNTIQSGTSGYQTPNSNKDRPYDQCDEFYALGVTLLHLILTFPGEPKNRNHYSTTFIMSDIEDVLTLFDIWSNKFVKNKNTEFKFELFTPQLYLAKDLIDKKIHTHEEIRKIVSSW